MAYWPINSNIQETQENKTKDYGKMPLLITSIEVFTKIFAQRIEHKAGVCKGMQDFCQNRFTIEAIFILKLLAKKGIENA